MNTSGQPRKGQPRELFLQALEKATAVERADFLDGACGEDVELRAAIEKLLANHHEDSFLERPAIAEPPTVRDADLDEAAIGQRIGRYKLLEKLGEGGCGMVYVAEQTEPVRRRVALKVIKLGMDTKAVVARFEAERQALAMMDHPNIAKVLDAGLTEESKSAIQSGRPYFVMELVRGIKITDYCDQNKLSTNERLDLFIKVCRAIQHAHQKGIIHRDIKPSNILVTLHDGVPVPKVIDFGIAKATEGKLTDATVYTQLHQFIGTPAYMSPEQAEMSGLDIDTRSDIYSLGVLLYELLTGKTPFDAKELIAQGIDAMRRTIREKEPLRPSTKLATLEGEERTTTAKRHAQEMPRLIHQLRGDLDWIVMKCLEKDRTRRYETANGLAMDLKRHLNNEPVVARPPSAAYRFQKLVRRNKLAFAAAGAVVGALVLGLAVAVIALARESLAKQRALAAEAKQSQLREEAVVARNDAVAQRERAVASEREARLNLYAADMMTAQQHLARGNLGAAKQLLDAHGPRSGEDPRGWEWRYLREQAEGARPVRLEGHTGTVKRIRFSPDGRILASAGGDFRLWDLDKQNQSRPWNRPEKVRSFDFTRDGRLGVLTVAGELLLLDPIALRVLKSFPVAGAKSMAFSPTADGVAIERENASAIWLDLNTGASQPIFDGADVWVTDFSDDGTLVCGLRGDYVFVWSIPDKKLLAKEPKHPDSGWLFDLKFLPGRRGVVVVSFNRAPAVLSPKGSEWRWELPFVDFTPDERGTSGLAVSKAGGFLATSTFNHEVSLWDLGDSRRLVRFHGHQDETWSVAVSPDGRTVASGGQDRLILLWDPRWRAPEPRINGAFKRSALVFSPDSRWLALRAPSNVVEIWDLPDHRLVKRLPDAGVPAYFGEGDGELVTVKESHLLGWDRKTWKPTNTVKLEFTPAMMDWGPLGDLLRAAVGGELFAVGDTTGIVHVLNRKSRREVSFVKAGAVALALSPNDRWLALIEDTEQSTVQLWELRDGKARLEASRRAHARDLAHLVFSPDSRRLATFAGDSLAKIWSVEPFELLHELRGHKRGLFGGGFSPDGRTLASVEHVHDVNLWHVETGRQLASFVPAAPAGTSTDLVEAAFSPDGQYLVVCRIDGSCQFWHAPPLEPRSQSLTK